MSTSKKQIFESCTKYIETFKKDLLEQFCEQEDEAVRMKISLFFEHYPTFVDPAMESKKKLTKGKKQSLDAKLMNKQADESSLKETEIWLQNVSGINYYVDKENNVYSVEDYMFYMEQFTTKEATTNINPLKRFGRLIETEGQYSIITTII